MKMFSDNPRFTLLKLPLIGIGIFIALTFLAMKIYPGGTIQEKDTIGYIFSENYISDLGRYRTYADDSNAASMILFMIAMAAMGFSLFGYFYGTYTYFKKHFNPKISTFKLGTFFAMCGCICMAGVGLTPADVNLDDHMMFALWLFRFIFGFAVLYAISFYQMDESTKYHAAGYGLIALATGSYILFSDFKLSSIIFTDNHLAEVIAQKLITGALITGTIIIGYFNFRILKNHN